MKTLRYIALALAIPLMLLGAAACSSDKSRNPLSPGGEGGEGAAKLTRSATRSTRTATET